LDLALLDHVIVGDEGGYSFREAGQLGATSAGR
jgi:DNA repair protein RadC